jgi:hypothetical protein
MEVNCEFLDERTTDTTGQIAARTINAGAAGNFEGKIIERMPPGGDTIVFDDDMEMLVIGGRTSICNAFAKEPVASFYFEAPRGKMIFASHAASSRKRWAFGAGAARVTQLLSGPAYNLGTVTATAFRDPNPRHMASLYKSTMKSTYSRKINEGVFGVLNQAAKTRTVLHLFSDNADPTAQALGTRLNGASLSFQLARYFA